MVGLCREPDGRYDIGANGCGCYPLRPLQGGLDAARWPGAPNGQSLFWAGLNKGKQSIAIDMKHLRGREIITAGGKDAGLFLTTLGVHDWMDHETLSQHCADMVMVTLAGDRMGRPQVDYAVNPAVGFPDATGPERPTKPVAHTLSARDCIAGKMAVTGRLAAERQRLRMGQGHAVVLTLKDVAAAMVGNLGIIGDLIRNRTDPEKVGNALFGRMGMTSSLPMGGGSW